MGTLYLFRRNPVSGGAREPNNSGYPVGSVYFFPRRRPIFNISSSMFCELSHISPNFAREQHADIACSGRVTVAVYAQNSASRIGLWFQRDLAGERIDDDTGAGANGTAPVGALPGRRSTDSRATGTARPFSGRPLRAARASVGRSSSERSAGHPRVRECGTALIELNRTGVAAAARITTERERVPDLSLLVVDRADTASRRIIIASSWSQRRA